jgi:hypothetical protein
LFLAWSKNPLPRVDYFLASDLGAGGGVHLTGTRTGGGLVNCGNPRLTPSADHRANISLIALSCATR